MLIKPWGVVLLAIVGILGVLGILVGIVTIVLAGQDAVAAIALGHQLKVAIDSVSRLGCRVR